VIDGEDLSMPFSVSRLLGTLTSLGLLLSVVGCGGQTLQAPPAATTAGPAAQGIWVVRGGLPAAVQYAVVGPLAVRKLSYGGADWALQQLAEEARKAGANAVIDVEISFAPSFLGWATPHGKGTAVRIVSPPVEEVAQMPALQTEWW
jgi:hypothetical protein